MGISSSKLILGNVNKTASMQKTPKYVMDQIKQPLKPAHLRTDAQPVSKPSESKAAGGAEFMKTEVNLASVNTDPILKGTDLAGVNTDPILKTGGLDSSAAAFLKDAEAADKQSLAPDSMSQLRTGINADDLQSLQSISGQQPQLNPQASAFGRIEPLLTR